MIPLLILRINCQTCEEMSFPKFIGGNTEGTIMQDIAFNQYSNQLVICGDTHDTLIVNKYALNNYIPIVVSY